MKRAGPTRPEPERMDLPTDARERALALLEANHSFPGPFDFRVVVLPHGREPVLAALVQAVGVEERVTTLSERASANGNYVSVRIRAEVRHATEVLALYEVLRAVDGVVTVL